MSTQNLQGVIHCPDCGGVVGATTTTEHGAPCKCFQSTSMHKPRVAPEDARESSSAAESPEARESPDAPESRGADEAREPRLDDSGGAEGAPNDASSSAGADLGGTAVAEAEAKPQKICIGCGKNVAGHRRLKDSRGYMCLDCARAEQAGKKIQGAECPKCHRVVKVESIGEFDGKRMCQRCLREAREHAKPGSKKFRRVDAKHFDEAKKKQLIILASAAGILLLLMLIGLLF